MRSTLRWIWIAVLALPVVLACGGGDDDDDDSGLPGGGSGSSQPTTGSSSDAKIPKINDGNYSKAKVHVEITGDRKQTVDLDGGGIATGGFGLFTYAGSDATIQISLSGTAGEVPGGIFVTTKEVVTGGEWGKQCKVSIDQSGGKVKGEYSCDKLDAVDPGATKTYKVNLKGTFSAEP